MVGSHGTGGLAKYKCEPGILSVDQMPRHRHESSGQKTSNFKRNDETCFVKGQQ